jgi:hypothetical protein
MWKEQLSQLPSEKSHSTQEKMLRTGLPRRAVECRITEMFLALIRGQSRFSAPPLHVVILKPCA